MSTEPTSSHDDEGAVLLEHRGAIATLTISRPAALNALTWAMYQQLEAFLERLATDEATRVIILRGAGQAFAAGTDIQRFRGFSGTDGVAYERKMEAVIECLATLSKPTIAAIHGYAVGAGLAIAAACDLRYATPTSRFGVPIARTLGNCLALKTYRLLVEAFGPMRTREMLFLGRLMTAADALQNSFLTEIVDEERLMTHVTEIAQRICSHALLTIWAAKEAQKRLNTGADASEFDDAIARVYDSADFAKGVQAYLEKRKPHWRGQ